MNIKAMFLTFTNIRKWWDPIPGWFAEFFEGCAALIAALVRLVIVITVPIWFIPCTISILVRDYRLSNDLDRIPDAHRGRMILKMCIHREQITGLNFYGRIINHVVDMIAVDEDRTAADVWEEWYRSYRVERISSLYE